MAFKIISSKSSSSLPFFDEWKKDLNQETIEFLADKQMGFNWFREVESGKGFLVQFGHAFMIFIWKNSSEGKLFKNYIQDECGNLLILEFRKAKKGLSFILGVDDEMEVAVIKDKVEDDKFYTEVTTGNLSPIAPEENRKFFTELPELHPAQKAKSRLSRKPPSSDQRGSDG